MDYYAVALQATGHTDKQTMAGTPPSPLIGRHGCLHITTTHISHAH